MSQDHNGDDEMRIFSIEDQEDSDTEPLDLEEDAFEVFQAEMLPEFEEALEAIGAASLEPRMLQGFSDMGRNDVRRLKPVWNALPEEARGTIAELILAMGQTDILQDYQRFFSLMLDDAAAVVRETGALGLAMYEDEEYIEPLVRLMQSDPVTAVRVAAADALATFTTLGEFMELPERTANKLSKDLMRVVRDTQAPEAIRAAALGAAAVRSQDDAIQDTIEVFYESGSEELRIGAIQAMGRSGNTRWLPMLDVAVRDPDPEVRQLAARAMGPFESEVVPMLTMLVREDQEPAVRLEAIQALGTVGGRKAVDSLMTLRDYVSDDEIEAIDIAIEEAEAWVGIEEFDLDAEFDMDEGDQFL